MQSPRLVQRHYSVWRCKIGQTWHGDCALLLAEKGLWVELGNGCHSSPGKAHCSTVYYPTPQSPSPWAEDWGDECSNWKIEMELGDSLSWRAGALCWRSPPSLGSIAWLQGGLAESPLLCWGPAAISLRRSCHAISSLFELPDCPGSINLRHILVHVCVSRLGESSVRTFPGAHWRSDSETPSLRCNTMLTSWFLAHLLHPMPSVSIKGLVELIHLPLRCCKSDWPFPGRSDGTLEPFSSTVCAHSLPPWSSPSKRTLVDRTWGWRQRATFSGTTGMSLTIREAQYFKQVKFKERPFYDMTWRWDAFFSVAAETDYCPYLGKGQDISGPWFCQVTHVDSDLCSNYLGWFLCDAGWDPGSI